MERILDFSLLEGLTTLIILGVIATFFNTVVMSGRKLRHYSRAAKRNLKYLADKH